jgi:hypothetical protein
VYTRDRSSGRIHERDEMGRTHEADNLDDAGAFEELTVEEFTNAEPDQLCKRCFPDAEDHA